jgi:hypothetical protein
MGSGGSRSLWPPGKLFETVVAGLSPGYTVLQSGSFFVQTPSVAFTMFETLVATSLRLLLQIKLHRITLQCQTT